MFRSQFSGKVSAEKVSPVKVVVETRRKRYENYVRGDLIVSYGTEIVRELSVLPSEVAAVKEKYNLKD